MPSVRPTTTTHVNKAPDRVNKAPDRDNNATNHVNNATNHDNARYVSNAIATYICAAKKHGLSEAQARHLLRARSNYLAHLYT
jgi:hypothetical protein